MFPGPFLRIALITGFNLAVVFSGGGRARADLWKIGTTRGFMPEPEQWSDRAEFKTQKLSLGSSAFSPSRTWPDTLRLEDEDMTLRFSGDEVIHLVSLKIAGGELTLEGTAGTALTIEVTNKFSMSKRSKIILSGGLQINDVTFDILGKGHAVRINGESMLSGTLNAAERAVQISHGSSLVGIVNARRLSLVTGGTVVPPVVSQ